VAEGAQRAVDEATAAIALDPSSSTAYYNRALAYVSLQQGKIARADIDELVTLDPTLASKGALVWTAAGSVGVFARALRFETTR
jgi:regulator of sirC expression with transglutaminase-like and TPR domain